jgi:hypothetical protein
MAELTPDQERQVLAIVSAAANACGGRRDAMLVGLLGAIIVAADAMPDPGGALEAVIAGLEDGRKHLLGIPGARVDEGACQPRPGSERPS